jgi:hypothetical protein
MMTVPLGSVVPCERKLTIFSTEKMRSLGHCQLRNHQGSEQKE